MNKIHSHKERWSDADITKTAKILLHAQKNKSLLVKIIDEIVHWMIVMIILFGNTVISVFIVFISNMFNRFFFYLIIGLTAIIFGIMVEIPIKEVERLDKNKHFISRTALPLLALVNIYILIGVKAVVEHYSKLQFDFNPFIAGIVYGILFLIPHIVMWISSVKKK
jgi:hypothetical protein